MSMRNRSFRFLKLTSLSMLIAGAALAAPGTTVRITNTSKQPWTLRITEDAANPVIVAGSKDSKPTELGPQSQKFVFSIEPGDTCVLQFKEKREQAVKQKVGLVDRNGQEKGQVELQSSLVSSEGASEGVESLRGQDLEERIATRLIADEQVGQVLKLDSEEACCIVADTWN